MSKARHLCRRCKKRKAVYKRPNGRYAADKDHDLCAKCSDTVNSQLRARRLAPKS